MHEDDYTVKDATSMLVQEAYKKGSEDNLTAIMVRFLWPGDDSHEIFLQQPDAKAQGKRGNQTRLNASGQALKKQASAKADPFGSPPPGYVAGGGRGGIGRSAQPKSDPFGEPPPGYVAGGGRGGIGRGAAAAAKAADPFGAPPPGYVAGRGRGAVGLKEMREESGEEPDAKRPKIEVEAKTEEVKKEEVKTEEVKEEVKKEETSKQEVTEEKKNDAAGRGHGAAKPSGDAPPAKPAGGRGAGRGAGRGRGAAKKEEPQDPPSNPG